MSTALSAVKALEGVAAQADKALSATDDAQWTCNLTLGFMTSQKNADDLVAAIHSGKIGDVGDFMHALYLSDEMPYYTSRMQKEIIPIILATKFQGRGETAAQSISTVLATDWSKKSGSKTVRDGFTSIQSTFKTELRDAVNKLNAAMKSLDDTLNKFPLRKNNMNWYVGGTAYKRCVFNYYDLPCMYMETSSWSTQDGLSASMQYPTYYACKYGPTWFYIVSHHMPWYRWSFTSNQ